MNGVELVDRPGEDVAQQKISECSGCEICARTVVIELKQSSCERIEFIGVGRSTPFPAKLDLVLASDPGEVVHISVAVHRSLQAFLLPGSRRTQRLQSAQSDAGKIVVVEGVQTNLRVEIAMRTFGNRKKLPAGVGDAEFIDLF